jgi:hypothetical protein
MDRKVMNISHETKVVSRMFCKFMDLIKFHSKYHLHVYSSREWLTSPVYKTKNHALIFKMIEIYLLTYALTYRILMGSQPRAFIAAGFRNHESSSNINFVENNFTL